MNWNYLIFGLLGVLVGAAMTIGWGAHRPPVPKPAPEPVAPTMAPVRDPGELAAPLPTVRGIGMRDWITNYNSHATWADVVREFYKRLLQRRHIAGFFPQDTTALQSHFAKAMILVTSKGMTWGVVEAMREAHANVRDRNGNPITGPVFDEIVGVLVGVLQDYKIPAEAIGELALVVPPLREVIVKA